MKVRLGFAIAAQMEPDILIIDEVLAVGDVGFRAKCFNAIYKMMQNAAVILVSHSMPQVSRVCTDIMVMHHGQAIFQGQDVPKGIDVYYSYFKGESESISGSGKATIHNIELQANGEKIVDSLNYLDNLSLEIELEVATEIEKLDFAISIMNQELQIVAQCIASWSGFKIINTQKCMQIAVNLGEINLNPGIYSLTVSVNRENMGEVLCRYDNIRKLKVIGNFFGYAPIQLLGSWHVTQ